MKEEMTAISFAQALEDGDYETVLKWAQKEEREWKEFIAHLKKKMQDRV